MENNKTGKNYLLTLLYIVKPVTINVLIDQIILLEVTFEYNIWYQPNQNINESQITYYTDEENEYKKP